MKSQGAFKISFITLDRLAQEDKSLKRKKTLLSDAQKLSDDELSAKLRSLGIMASKHWLRELSEQHRSAQELSQFLCAEYGTRDFDMDWVWFCVTILWERWFPDVPNLEMIDNRMQLGYERLEQKDVIGACEAWLSYWKDALKLMEKWKIKTVSQFDEQFLQTQSLFNWCQDFEMELNNAALDEWKYHAVRLLFCQQIIPLVDPEEKLIKENMRRAMAESYFDMGKETKADRLYEEWLAADPRWGWGWIGWSDLYWLFSRGERDYRRAEEILTKAMGTSELRDKADVLERLSDLYEESGQKEKKRKVDAQLNSLRSQHVKSSSVFQDTTTTDGHPQYFHIKNNISPFVGERGKKVGRNDPCPCGSGKKFKKCCGR